MDLVRRGVVERPLRVDQCLLGPRPGHQDVAEVAERAGGVLALARGVRELVGLEQRAGLVRVHLDPRARHVHDRVRARGVVAQPGGQLERAPPPAQRLLAVVGEHRQLRDPAARPGQLDRLAERIEDRDGLDRLVACRAALAGEPVEARQHAGAAAECGLVAELPVNRYRALDRLEGVVEPADEIRGRGELLEQVRLLHGREPVDEVGGPPVVGVRLSVRLEGGGPARRDQRVLTHDLVLPGGLGVMDDLGRVCARGQQRAEHVRVEPPARRGRYRRQDGVAGQLVPEAQVPVVELEQLAPLRLLGRRRPPGHDRVERRRAHAIRHDRDQLHEPARGVVQPRRARQHGVRDRRRQLGRVPRREQLGHVERVAARDVVDGVRVVARERGHRVPRQGEELDQLGVVRPDGADRRVERVARGSLARAVGRHEQRGQGADAPAEHGERVERRVVGPVHVLEHQDGGSRRPLELLDQEVLDLVRRRAGGERLPEAGRDAAREVAERAQRTRDRQVVAGAEQDAGAVLEIVQKPPHQRRLADPRLAADPDGPPSAGRSCSVRLGKRLQRGLTLEQLHANSRHVGTYVFKHR